MTIDNLINSNIESDIADIESHLYDGSWKLDGNVVRFTRHGREATYTIDSIEFVINNVKKNKDHYTDVAYYTAYLRHLERGRSLFNVSFLDESIRELSSTNKIDLSIVKE
jgi:hypothetical protein